MIAASIGDNFLDYLFPLIAVALYFISSTRKQKKSSPVEYGREQVEEETFALPLPPRKEYTPSDLPPIRRKAATLQSSIEERKIDSAISVREFSTSITEERASTLVSSEMLKHIDLDPAYAQKTKTGISRARKLFKNKATLREAFLLQEILKRPYE